MSPWQEQQVTFDGKFNKHGINLFADKTLQQAKSLIKTHQILNSGSASKYMKKNGCQSGIYSSKDQLFDYIDEKITSPKLIKTQDARNMQREQALEQERSFSKPKLFECSDLKFNFITNKEMPNRISIGPGLHQPAVMKQIISKKAKIDNPLLPNIVKKREVNDSKCSN